MISHARRICVFATLVTMALGGRRITWKPVGFGKYEQVIVEENKEVMEAWKVDKAMEASLEDLEEHVKEKAWIKMEGKKIKRRSSVLPASPSLIDNVKIPAIKIKTKLQELTIKKDVLSALVKVDMESVPKYKPTKEELEYLHNKAGVEVPKIPIGDVYKVKGLENAIQYNDCMGRVLGVHIGNDGKRTGRWNLEIVTKTNKRKILAVNPNKNLEKADSVWTLNRLDGFLVGDTVRYVTENFDGYHMGQIQELDVDCDSGCSLSFTLTKTDETVDETFLIAPCNGRDSIKMPGSRLIRVTTQQLEAMASIEEQTAELTNTINTYIRTLNSGSTSDALDAMFAHMRTILHQYQDYTKIIGWRQKEMQRKLTIALTQMEFKLDDNKSKDSSFYARVSLKMLVNGMSLERARRSVEHDTEMAEQMEARQELLKQTKLAPIFE